MTVRSAVLGRYIWTALSLVALYPVPAGTTALIKTISGANAGPAAAQLYVAIRWSGTMTETKLFNAILNPGTDPVHVNTWVVAQENDLILAFGAAADLGVYVSGSILFGVAPKPPAAQLLPAEQARPGQLPA
jgi:hypothetical protein